MSKILLGISALLVGVSAFLGFLTKSKVTALASDKDRLAIEAAEFQKEAADAKTAVGKATQEAEMAKAAAEKATADLASTTQNLQTAKSEMKSLQDQVEQLKKDIDAAKTAQATEAVPTGDTPEMVELKTKLTEAETKALEAEQLVTSLTEKVKATESEANQLREEKARHDRQLMAKGLEGQILAVNQAWNFVVLSIGNRQGAVANAEMVVTRGTELIGRIRITSVEPATSIADIVPGSLSSGTRIQPGDKVIFPGT